jgi:hypothetical protein
MPIENFPCLRCRPYVAVACACLAVSFVVPLTHWPFIAAEAPHIHPDATPGQFMPSLSVNEGSTVTNQGALYR